MTTKTITDKELAEWAAGVLGFARLDADLENVLLSPTGFFLILELAEKQGAEINWSDNFINFKCKPTEKRTAFDDQGWVTEAFEIKEHGPCWAILMAAREIPIK